MLPPFQMRPPTRVKEQLAPVSEDMKPIVGLAVVLRKEEQVGFKYNVSDQIVGLIIDRIISNY